MVGAPFVLSGGMTLLGNAQGVDAVSGATEILDQPSGSFYVVINKDLHADQDNLKKWQDFFSGQDSTYIFEDISSVVAKGDLTALELAESFQSQLPEHQMTIRVEDPILMLSKGKHGRFDIIIISKEYSQAYQARDVMDRDSSLIIPVEQS